MRTILTLRQADITPDYGGPAGPYKDRHAARAVVQDREGRIALMFAGAHGYYKLPGGGVDEGERAGGLSRELLEEVGAHTEIIREIGRVEEWREAVSLGIPLGLHQVSDAYYVRVLGELSEPQFNQHEIDNGMCVEWVCSLEHAIEKVEASLTSDGVEERFMSTRDSTILRTAATKN